MNRFRCIALFAGILQLANVTASVSAEPEPIVKLTKNASAQIQKLILDQKLPADTLLRVGVTQGKTGFQHTLGFAKKTEKTTDDLELESHGVRIIVDRRSCLYLQGTTVDYEQKPKPGFRFDNPNATKETK